MDSDSHRPCSVNGSYKINGHVTVFGGPLKTLRNNGEPWVGFDVQTLVILSLA